MAGKLPPSNQSLEAEAPIDAIRVLVVDDDKICLSIVSGMLRAWTYQVVPVENAREALTTLRRGRRNFFHLVVTDVHMPDMDGFEFQKQVREEFKLPIVMMSADDSERSMLRALQAGAAFYFVKPVNFDDLKDLWQYAALPKQGASAVIKQIERAQRAVLPHERIALLGTGASVSSRVEEEMQERESFKKMAEEKANETSERGKAEAVVPKKPRLVWTDELEHEFLEAIRKIGLERAIPTKILEHMSNSGVTRQNVASHLQKYRTFLKRVAEVSNYGVNSTEKNIVQKTLRSNFITGHRSLVRNALQQGLMRNAQTGPTLTAVSNHQASSSRNPALAIGYQRSHPVGNHGGSQANRSGPELVLDAEDNKSNVSVSKALRSKDENMVSLDNSDLIPNINFNHAISDQMGYFSGGTLPNRLLIHGNITGEFHSGYYSQQAHSPAAFGSANRFSPRFYNVNQPGNIPFRPSQMTNITPGQDMLFVQFSGPNLRENSQNEQNNPPNDQVDGDTKGATYLPSTLS